jgi:hypothetical protein
MTKRERPPSSVVSHHEFMARRLFAKLDVARETIANCMHLCAGVIALYEKKISALPKGDPRVAKLKRSRRAAIAGLKGIEANFERLIKLTDKTTAELKARQRARRKKTERK